MADEKTPRPKIELDSRGESPERPASGPEGQADDGSYTVGEAVRDGSARLTAWVRRTFPGHEHAFWGGVLGFLAAILVLVVVGVAIGQALDGDSKIMDLFRRLFSGN